MGVPAKLVDVGRLAARTLERSLLNMPKRKKGIEFRRSVDRWDQLFCLTVDEVA